MLNQHSERRRGGGGGGGRMSGGGGADASPTTVPVLPFFFSDAENLLSLKMLVVSTLTMNNGLYHKLEVKTPTQTLFWQFCTKFTTHIQRKIVP